MKMLLPFLVCLMCVSGRAEGQVLRITLEWLNAGECGLEGCKPQNIIMKESSIMSFGWLVAKERGRFQVQPRLQGEMVHLTLKRIMKDSEEGAQGNVQLSFGMPEEVAVGEVRFRVTVTAEQATEEK